MVRLTTTAPPAPPAIARQRNAILAVLVLLAVAGWIVVLDEARQPMAMGGMDMAGMDMAGMDMAGMDMADMAVGADLTMGGSWPLFLGMWVAMMVAMMFPAAAPMALMYGRMRRSDPVSVALFVGSYLALWSAFGVVAYVLSAWVESAASRSAWVTANWGRAGGVLIVLAGIYQLTPLKEVCLRHCRSPLAFVMTHWRDGRSGALRMGLVHGVYCAGCCWLLFVILIPLGVMNVAAMVAIAALVFAEKVLPYGRGIGIAASVALLVLGVAVVAEPSLLPTVA